MVEIAVSFRLHIERSSVSATSQDAAALQPPQAWPFLQEPEMKAITSRLEAIALRLQGLRFRSCLLLALLGARTLLGTSATLLGTSALLVTRSY